VVGRSDGEDADVVLVTAVAAAEGEELGLLAGGVGCKLSLLLFLAIAAAAVLAKTSIISRDKKSGVL